MTDATEQPTPSSASPLAEVADLVRNGNPAEALTRLKERIRDSASNADLRLSLAQLEMILGHWDKAMSAADTASTLDTARGLLCQQWKLLIAAEQTRGEVFAGTKTAIIMGDPPEWMAPMQDALRLDAEGQAEAADAARRSALEGAPARSGRINGTPFAWLCDADERIGPAFEAVINGRYTWVPQTAVSTLKVQKPNELIDLVWVETVLRLTNGGETTALIPVRYNGSDSNDDTNIMLGRLTTFDTTPGGTSVGLGQRLLATDVDDYPLLQIETIEFDD